ncbi:MAG: acyltransferase domain-containing protein [Pseudomonadota bacterium]|nr:acyltransferase domain-containing protein [Pseudomonadota bacterium]
MQRFAILCPGQGGQHAAMFAQTGTALQTTLSTLLGAEVDTILSDPTRLFDNRFAQPLLVAAGMAQWAQLREHIPPPTMIAGYSVGELTAYGVADALSTPALLALVDQRARLTSGCVDPAHPHAMVAVSGIPLAGAMALITARGLYLAIRNGADRLIAGGMASQCEGIEAEICALGGESQRVAVSVAAHTPLLHGATNAFAQLLRANAWARCEMPVLAGISAEKVSDPARAMATLCAQLTSPILWDSCMDALKENRITVTLELGPGRALSSMMRARYPWMACRAVDEFRSIAAAGAWLQRQVAE